VGDALGALGMSELGQTETDVPFYSQPGKDAALLKYQDAARVRSSDDLAVDPDRATGRRQKSGHRVEQGRFSATGGTYKANKLTVFDIEVDIFQHGQGLAIAVKYHAKVFRA
jgi:hypothetical protein